jgi:hypothetical protein
MLTNAVLLGSILVPLGLLEKVHPPGSEAAPRLGMLPLARRDVERLRQTLGLQRRLHDIAAGARAQRALVHRSIFREALTWLDIHADNHDLSAHWKTVLESVGQPGTPSGERPEGGDAPFGPRRRRRRRRRRPISLG